ncbi:MAG: hypothetical protein E7295_09185 [Lachnospiraceae bacterium]|jgi:hypothetical protein|nr:hypothetical protein [Lachnospiraceae bacterium]
MTFYDNSGRAVAYSDDGETIYLFNGAPVAYFYGDKVYDFRGQHLGFFSNGWIRNIRGFCVFFTENAIGGPIKPVKHIKPVKSVKHVKPVKCVRHVPFVKPVDQNSWSSVSGERFFILT